MMNTNIYLWDVREVTEEELMSTLLYLLCFLVVLCDVSVLVKSKHLRVGYER